MKSCPTCNRTYPDDTLAFCLMDGSVLSAPYDPELKKEGRPAREPSPPRTEVMRTPEFQDVPATQPAMGPDSLSTITGSMPANLPTAKTEQQTPAADLSNSTETWQPPAVLKWVVVGIIMLILLVVLIQSTR